MVKPDLALRELVAAIVAGDAANGFTASWRVTGVGKCMFSIGSHSSNREVILPRSD